MRALSLLLMVSGCSKGISPRASHQARELASDVLECPARRVDLEVDLRSERTGQVITVLARGCGHGVQLVRASGDSHWAPVAIAPASPPPRETSARR